MGRSTFYRWYQPYLEEGFEGLAPGRSAPRRFWNRIPDEVRERVVAIALENAEHSIWRLVSMEDSEIKESMMNNWEKPTTAIINSENYHPVPSLLSSDIDPASSLVLITGGSGYIGAMLAKHLVSNGWKVRIMDSSADALYVLQQDFSSMPNYYSLEFQNGNVCDPKDVLRSCQGVTHIVHLAGIANARACRENPHQAFEVNCLSARNYLECMRSSEKFLQFVYPSSVAGMYANTTTGQVKETSQVFPVDDYGISKQAGEQFCRAYARLYGMRTVIFRPGTIQRMFCDRARA